MNGNLLKKMISEKGYTQEKVATGIGMQRATFNRKLHGFNKGFFLKEAWAVGRFLGLTAEQMAEVFFGQQGG